ncbi:hypothetical protein CONPUDRAFT_76071 [Coniophora puteana RWD-64-598 SS2]|uniref:Uncharacterized protein n=1 Tax=Coniophora puteana (strain RWD-64-598) TaxID=741705 RepID=A0A5M3MFB8_CONPW|nr:uncharacterized protein CONPUDRAFT_76071 [Coniophora puteana RWD-64-598 SS2]EIW77315.1 hypothetical protein CONPUDRAFT_76071 [Coniophora puteana RWD-64-598 SS2]
MSRPDVAEVRALQMSGWAQSSSLRLSSSHCQIQAIPISAGISIVLVYRILLNLDQEVDLIWVRFYSALNTSEALHLIQVRIVPEENETTLWNGKLLIIEDLCRVITVSTAESRRTMSNNSAPHHLLIICVASIILGQSIFMYGLIFGVHAMMVQRVCAMYGMAPNVRAFLIVCFATVQLVNAVAFITLMATMYYVDNSLPTQPTETCTWAFPTVTSKIIAISRWARAGLETILLVMALYQAVVHLRDRFRGTQFNLDTFVAILARDHIFYVIVASMSWTVDASSFLGTYPEVLFLFISVLKDE